MGERGLMSWYDYPQVFDILYDTDTRIEADFIEQIVEKHCSSLGNVILEPACGTGRMLREFYRRGYRAIGFDNNPSMVAFAKRFKPRNRKRYNVTPGEMSDFNYKQGVDAAFCLFGTFRYLLNDTEAKGHLRSIRKSLRKGGIYILGLNLTDYLSNRFAGERTVAERKGIRVTCNIKCWKPDARKRLQRFRSRMNVIQDKDIWQHETTWHFRTYGPIQAKRALSAVDGLKIVEMYNYDFDIDRTCKLYDAGLDRIFVLKKI
ncbi:MAG: class I SAM-dependent methyltransferase [bacterium]|nr:MAG: class I SAM-dependent methyltransferase [bacterium]